MYDDKQYYWVVICRNHWFHRRKNLFFGHTIPLAEADSYSPPPRLDSRFSVRCDDCGKEYLYQPKDLLRAELEPLAEFEAHPLFQ